MSDSKKCQYCNRELCNVASKTRHEKTCKTKEIMLQKQDDPEDDVDPEELARNTEMFLENQKKIREERARQKALKATNQIGGIVQQNNQQIDGQNNNTYNINANVITKYGELDLEALQEALSKVPSLNQDGINGIIESFKIKYPRIKPPTKKKLTANEKKHVRIISSKITGEPELLRAIIPYIDNELEIRDITYTKERYAEYDELYDDFMDYSKIILKNVLEFVEVSSSPQVSFDINEMCFEIALKMADTAPNIDKLDLAIIEICRYIVSNIESSYLANREYYKYQRLIENRLHFLRWQIVEAEDAYGKKLLDLINKYQEEDKIKALETPVKTEETESKKEAKPKKEKPNKAEVAEPKESKPKKEEESKKDVVNPKETKAKKEKPKKIIV